MYCVGETVVESKLPVRFIVFFFSLKQSIKISLNLSVFQLLPFLGLNRPQGISSIKLESRNEVFYYTCPCKSSANVVTTCKN